MSLAARARSLSLAAHEISASMRYGRMSVERAAAAALEKARTIGGSDGLIAIGRRGNFTLPFNTPGMYRGWIGPEGEPWVFIYRDQRRYCFRTGSTHRRNRLKEKS